MSINTGLSNETLKNTAQSLNILLADEYVLFTKTYNYHWNISGSNFHDLHKMLEDQYRELLEIVDDVAERVRALGAPSLGTLAEFSQHARLTEKSGQPNAHDMLTNLLADHETILRSIREDMKNVVINHNDYGTENFLGELLEKHEKIAWMLRATVVDNK